MVGRRTFFSWATFGIFAASASASDGDLTQPQMRSLDEQILRSPEGGKISIPSGNVPLAAGLRLAVDRLQLQGQGANVSLLVHASNAGNAVNVGNGSVGGVVESAVRDVGFASAGEQDSAAIHLENVSTALVERIGIAEGNWRGARATGISTSGREMITVLDCTIACARPLVHRRNTYHPTLALDHVRVQRSMFFATGRASACIECEEGVNISTSSYQNLALCGGRDGFSWIDRQSTIASFGLAFRDMRVEQGVAKDGWSVNIAIEAGLQSLIMENCRLDRGRNGIRLRNVQRITLINVEMDTPAEDPNCLLDIVGVPGTVLIMINCFAQQNGVIRLKNLRRVLGLEPYLAHTTLGGFELWSYAAPGSESPRLQIQTPPASTTSSH